jgi:hypothetical protein
MHCDIHDKLEGLKKLQLRVKAVAGYQRYLYKQMSVFTASVVSVLDFGPS